MPSNFKRGDPVYHTGYRKVIGIITNFGSSWVTIENNDGIDCGMEMYQFNAYSEMGILILPKDHLKKLFTKDLKNELE